MRGLMKCQKSDRQNTTVDKPFHNVTTNDPLSHHSNEIVNSNSLFVSYLVNVLLGTFMSLLTKIQVVHDDEHRKT